MTDCIRAAGADTVNAAAQSPTGNASAKKRAVLRNATRASLEMSLDGPAPPVGLVRSPGYRRLLAFHSAV